MNPSELVSRIISFEHLLTRIYFNRRKVCRLGMSYGVMMTPSFV